MLKQREHEAIYTLFVDDIQDDTWYNPSSSGRVLLYEFIEFSHFDVFLGCSGY